MKGDNVVKKFRQFLGSFVVITGLGLGCGEKYETVYGNDNYLQDSKVEEVTTDAFQETSPSETEFQEVSCVESCKQTIKGVYKLSKDGKNLKPGMEGQTIELILQDGPEANYIFTYGIKNADGSVVLAGNFSFYDPAVGDTVNGEGTITVSKDGAIAKIGDRSIEFPTLKLVNADSKDTNTNITTKAVVWTKLGEYSEKYAVKKEGENVTITGFNKEFTINLSVEFITNSFLYVKEMITDAIGSNTSYRFLNEGGKPIEYKDASGTVVAAFGVVSTNSSENTTCNEYTYDLTYDNKNLSNVKKVGQSQTMADSTNIKLVNVVYDESNRDMEVAVVEVTKKGEGPIIYTLRKYEQKDGVGFMGQAPSINLCRELDNTGTEARNMKEMKKRYADSVRNILKNYSSIEKKKVSQPKIRNQLAYRC